MWWITDGLLTGQIKIIWPSFIRLSYTTTYLVSKALWFSCCCCMPDCLLFLHFLFSCCVVSSENPFSLDKGPFLDTKKMYLLSASKLKISAKRVLKTVKLGIEYQCLWSAYTTCQVVHTWCEYDISVYIWVYISIAFIIPNFY